MTKTTIDIVELLQKHDQSDFLRTIAESVLQLLMEADVDGLIGAGRHERAEHRTTWRMGEVVEAIHHVIKTGNLQELERRRSVFNKVRKVELISEVDEDRVSVQ